MENIQTKTDAEIEALKADYKAKIAEIEAQQRLALQGAEAEVKRMKEVATNSLNKLRMDVFRNDAQAFLSYTLAKELDPKLVMRLFHSGPGTLWTNMGEKGVSLLLPAPAAAAKPLDKPAPIDKVAAGGRTFSGERCGAR